MLQGVPIGEAARRSGVKAPTIRYYEQIGLLPAPPRSEGNRRHYGSADLQRLAFIRHARELGFEIEAIRALVTLQDDPNSALRHGRRDRQGKAGRGRAEDPQPWRPEGRARADGRGLPARAGGPMPGDRGAGRPRKMPARPALSACQSRVFRSCRPADGPASTGLDRARPGSPHRRSAPPPAPPAPVRSGCRSRPGRPTRRSPLPEGRSQDRGLVGGEAAQPRPAALDPADRERECLLDPLGTDGDIQLLGLRVGGRRRASRRRASRAGGRHRA